MKNCFLFFFLLLASESIAQEVDVLHYRYFIELTDNHDTLYGKAEIRVVAKRSETFWLDFVQLGDNGRGMEVVKVEIGKDAAPYPYKHEKNKLLLPLAKKGQSDTILFRINYKGIPADGLIISKNKFGERTFFADNWPNRAHHWIPCVDRPDDKASFEFIVTAPAHYSVVSNGVKVEEKEVGEKKKRTHWQEDIALPTKVMVIGAARFAVKTYGNSPDNVPVSAWVYPPDSTKGFYDFALAPEILSFCSHYIDSFPYQKLANVQSTTIFGGMENASCIFYAEGLINGKRSMEATIAHEIAHQWFGDMVSEKSFAHLWLSEGFATYLTQLYFEHKYGREVMQKRLQDDRAEIVQFAESSNRPVVDSTEDLMSLLNSNSYAKGGWVLHMLRNEVGDIVFRQIIQTFYHQYKGGNADTRDFEAVAEKVSGKELTPFFDQWLYQPGIPKLQVRWKPGNNEVRVRQVQETLFRFPLEILLTSKQKTQQLIKLNITQKEQTFQIPGSSNGKSISLDPNTSLLFSGSIITEAKPGLRKKQKSL